MGTVDVKAYFPSKRHEISMPPYQMVVLMLFNNREEISFQDILHETNIPESDLKRTLITLSLGKFKILKKGNPKSKDIQPHEQFRYNSGFSHPAIRFKIANIASKLESDNERKETEKKIDEDRRHLIEACIVRIMKSRKRLDHNHLIAEVTQQLSSRFLPEPAMIKKRIEALIDREYLEREDSDRKVYTYLA